MNRLLLFCPISRAVRFHQKPITCYRLLKKSFSTTTCRKYKSASILRSDSEVGRNPRPPAETGTETGTDDLFENDVDPRELSYWGSFLFLLLNFY